jgi:uncharacterized ferritin-like protein (DUF455 family)
MGPDFTSDFLDVAADEAMHFALIDRHLRKMGSHYGALPAHAGLWEAAHETRHDVAARLAIVPMVLEARGLDVTPAMLERVRASGDVRGAAILQRILDDEIRHVAQGVKHFVAFAEASGQVPDSLWKSLVRKHFKSGLREPFNDSARRSAGLSRDWYAGLVPVSSSGITPAA